MLRAAADGELPDADLRWLKPETALTVVLAARGYPEAPEKGAAIARARARRRARGRDRHHAGTELKTASSHRRGRARAQRHRDRRHRRRGAGARLCKAVDADRGAGPVLPPRHRLARHRPRRRVKTEDAEMSQSPPDLFPGFESRFVETGDARLFARIGGSGPPLLLVHGFPQTHVEWGRIAGPLAERFTVVAPDLRGYGASDAPASQRGEGYAKRVMARDAVALMRALGFDRFRLAGHDRGGRVAYRLALDHPQAVEALAVLDIVPTAEMWAGMDAARALQVYHWSFLAQPAPLPERLLERDHGAWLDHTLASWTAAKSLDCFEPAALAHYRAFFAAARAHPRLLRGLSRRRDARPRRRRGRSRRRPEDRRAAAGAVGGGRHSGRGRLAARRLAALGERRRAARRSTAAISCPRKIRKPRAMPCSASSDAAFRVRAARAADLPAIVAMLADDDLGRQREAPGEAARGLRPRLRRDRGGRKQRASRRRVRRRRRRMPAADADPRPHPPRRDARPDRGRARRGRRARPRLRRATDRRRARSCPRPRRAPRPAHQ
jgi:pimeloyl-ACP methyl ester carboxylesterase